MNNFKTECITCGGGTGQEKACTCAVNSLPGKHSFASYDEWEATQKFSPSSPEARYAELAWNAALTLRTVAPGEIIVSVSEMNESNGNTWYSVMLSSEPGQKPWDCHQVYSDKIKGRAEYEAAQLKHFLGQAEKPNILDFDTDAPGELHTSLSDSRIKLPSLTDELYEKFPSMCAKYHSDMVEQYAMDAVKLNGKATDKPKKMEQSVVVNIHRLRYLKSIIERKSPDMQPMLDGLKATDVIDETIAMLTTSHSMN